MKGSAAECIIYQITSRLERLATSWTVRGSNPRVGDDIFRTRPDPASYTMGIGSFPAVKRPGRGVDHPPKLAPRLKKE